MLKNEFEKELTKKSNNNSNGLNSTVFSSFKNNQRKDGKGNLIIKKKFPVKKTKHHAYLIDDLIPGKNLTNIIEVESYKKYNVDEEEEEIEENKEIQKKEKLEDNVVISQGCCFIF